MIKLIAVFLAVLCSFVTQAEIRSSSPPVTAGSVLPDQSGNSGEFLTTDGSTASWAAVSTVSSVTGVKWATSGSNINLASMPNAVDATVMTTGDLFLAKDQTAPAENGVYTYNGAGSAATRHADWDTAAEFLLGRGVTVTDGTVNGNTFWANQAVVATLGTTAVTFSQHGFDVARVPATLLPRGNALYDLGSAAVHWNNLYVGQVQFVPVTTTVAFIRVNDTTPTALAASTFLQAETQPVGVASKNATSTTAIFMETGNASAGGSGDIRIQTGTATGTRGSILLDSLSTQIKGTSGSATGALRFYDLDRSNYVELKSQDTVGSNFTLKWPTDDGTAGQLLQTDGSGILSWTSPAINVSRALYTTNYATLQDAVDAAEALAGSAINDEIGITLIIPPGDFSAQNMVIKKNVHLMGGGRLQTKVGAVTYQATDATNSPRRASIRYLNVSGTLTLTSSDQGGSPVYDPNFLIGVSGNIGMLISDVHLGTVNILRTGTVAFYNVDFPIGSSTWTFTTCDSVYFGNSKLGTIVWNTNDADANQPTGYSGGNPVFNSSHISSLELVKTGGSVTTYAALYGSYVDTLTLTGNSDVRSQGSHIETLNASGSANNFLNSEKMVLGLTPVQKTADPCADTSAFPTGTMFYNSTSNYFCFCNGSAADVQVHSPATACF